eukprot:2806837-Rhodomonas_salina.2
MANCPLVTSGPGKFQVLCGVCCLCFPVQVFQVVQLYCTVRSCTTGDITARVEGRYKLTLAGEHLAVVRRRTFVESCQ